MFEYLGVFEIFEKYYNDDLSEIPEPGRAIVVVISADGVIGNGGFEYFMESDFPNGVPHINLADSYDIINLKPAAGIIREACGLIGHVVGLPYEHRKIRFDKNKEKLTELFRMYLDLNKDITCSVKENSEKFCRDFNAHVPRKMFLLMKYYSRKLGIH